MKLGKHSAARRCGLVAALAALALGAAAPSALASDAFSDVPTGAPFHDEISIFKQTNITSGCTATTFCPQDFVKRQAMAAFIDRALGLVIRPGESTYKAVPGSLASAIDDDLSFVGTSANALVYRGPGNNVVGGHGANSVASGVVGATIAGGGEGSFENRVTDNYGAVGGGYANVAGNGTAPPSDTGGATVGGGTVNAATDVEATVAGGHGNTASGVDSAVAGGDSNTASGSYSAVGGGRDSVVSGYAATVGGGNANAAGGDYSTVAGGSLNNAAGGWSFAAGRRAKANHAGSFVWADSWAFDFPSLAVGNFRVRATGGVAFVSGIDATTGATTAGVDLAPGGGSWTTLSDRKAKRNFVAVDGRTLLRRLAGVPITTWSYKAQKPSIRHIGPTAQDFRRAFRVGESPKGITAVDADGVALAAIQALYRQNEAQARKIARLERTVAKLARRR